MSTLMLDDLMVDEEDEIGFRARVREKVYAKYGDTRTGIENLIDLERDAKERFILQREKALFNPKTLPIPETKEERVLEWPDTPRDMIYVSPITLAALRKIYEVHVYDPSKIPRRPYSGLSGNAKQRRTQRRRRKREVASGFIR